jgi:mRNA-degrading endonuclease toxin of MazEF toxin-antitoxin module
MSGRNTRSIRVSTVSNGTNFQKGDVFWAPDPFRQGSNPRLWLVLAADSLPYPGEEYICAALTTSDLPRNIEVDDNWIAGQDPDKTSYCSPWVVATIKSGAVVNPQGELTESFTDQMITECKEYLDAV